MFGVIFGIIITILLPLGVLVYATHKRSSLSYILGVIAFLVSQMLIRLPVISYLEKNSIAYGMMQITQPILYAIIIGLSAGIVEELARYVIMRFLMKRKTWREGFLFGVGHGGIEAVLFLGISAVTIILSPVMLLQADGYFIGAIERFFAMLLHIGLSIIVLTGVRRKKFMYVIVAIIIHGAIDSLVVILQMYLSIESALIIIESILAITAIAVFSYSIIIKRRGLLE